VHLRRQFMGLRTVLRRAGTEPGVQLCDTRYGRPVHLRLRKCRSECHLQLWSISSGIAPYCPGDAARPTTGQDCRLPEDDSTLSCSYSKSANCSCSDGVWVCSCPDTQPDPGTSCDTHADELHLRNPGLLLRDAGTQQWGCVDSAASTLALSRLAEHDWLEQSQC